jgi:hypothetical protein
VINNWVVVGFEIEDSSGGAGLVGELSMFVVRAAAKARYVWTFVKRGPCRRVDSLTDLDAENLRCGLRELQKRFGSLKALADAMGMPYQFPCATP